MTSVTRASRILPAILFGTLALSACGGDDEDQPDPTVTTQAVVTATPVLQETPAAPPVVFASPLAASPIPAGPLSSPAVVEVGTPQAEVLGATVVLTDFRVNVFQPSFEVGLPYTFVVQNNGGVAHEFVIERKGATDEPLANGAERAAIVEVPAGGQATLTWTFTEAGEYQFACHLAGHYERGMVQQTIVVGP